MEPQEYKTGERFDFELCSDYGLIETKTMQVITVDGRGVTDGVAYEFCQKINSQYPIVLVSWVEGLQFNEKLLAIKDYVLVCYCEYGYDFEIVDSHIWGENSEKFQRYYNGDWVKFDNWVKENPPKVLFKRELLKKDLSSTVLPIEYPCIVNQFPTQTESEFNSRPVSVYQYWGRSNEERLRIHAEIWLHGYKKGFQPCDNIYYINHYMNEERGEKWITLWIPHYARIDVNELLKINNLSKLSLSWQGAGFKCFRTAEAPTSSVMVMHKNDFCWSYDWNETNCILVDKGKEIERIEEALKRPDLYDIYVKGVENSNNYRLPQYLNRIENIINNA